MSSVCLDAITFGPFWGIRKLLSSCSLGFWQEHAFLWICKLEHFLQSEMSGNFPIIKYWFMWFDSSSLNLSLSSHIWPREERRNQAALQHFVWKAPQLTSKFITYQFCFPHNFRTLSVALYPCVTRFSVPPVPTTCSALLPEPSPAEHLSSNSCSSGVFPSFTTMAQWWVLIWCCKMSLNLHVFWSFLIIKLEWSATVQYLCIVLSFFSFTISSQNTAFQSYKA